MNELFKEKVLQACRQKLNDTIALYETEMAAAQESANNEEKSSAGDKYETGRAMSQNARNMFAQKLEEKKQEKRMLELPGNKLYVCKSNSDAPDLMCLTGAAIGQLHIDQSIVFVVSTQSPLGLVLQKQSIGSTFVWNQKPFILQNIL